MRNLQVQFPDTGLLTGRMADYAKNLNVELDALNRDLNKYVSRIVHTSITEAKTLTANDELVLANGTFTLTLPTAASSPGKVYHIKNIGTGVITVEGSETIDDETSMILSQYDCMDIASDGTEWWII